MNLSAQVWSAIWMLAAVLTAIRLLRAAARPEAEIRNGYRWLAGAAACLGVGATVQRLFGGLVGGAQPLRLADLISLAALPALIIGLWTLSGDVRRSDSGIVVDSVLIPMSVLVILFVTIFGPAYAHANAGPSAFTLALIRPVADLVTLGVVIRFVLRSPRLTLLPTLALTVLTLGDSLAVSARLADAAPGAPAGLALVAALVVLAGSPLTAPPIPDPAASAAVIISGIGDTAPVTPVPGPPPAAWPAAGPAGRIVHLPAVLWASPATVAALVCTALAAVVVIVAALAGALVSPAGLAVAVSLSLLLLVLRLVALGGQATSVAATARESERRFRVLARVTSDVVIVSGLTGDVEYVSPAIADFGFTSDEVIGTRLIDLVHPEDRVAALRVAVRGLRAGRPETFAGRARGADGSWRHVEAAVSRYSADGEQARLLITVRDVSDRVALRRQVTHLTYHDGLTGLPNRAYLEDLVKDVQETGARDTVTGVVLVDLDGYTAVNDLLGHSGGDVLLAQAGRRLRAAAPASATVARWGADEFAILITDAVGGDEVTAAAEALADHICAEPFAIGAKEIPLTASVGVATSDGADGDQLLGNAHVALSRAKEAGGSRVEVFAAEMHAEALRRLELATDLHQALAEHRLAIEYRPVADLRTGAVVAAEAVVCWSHDGSLVPAADLLEAAADAGVVVQIGDWLLAEASSQVADRRADGEHVGLWVTCSARQLTRPDAVASVRSALAESGLPPRALTLQVAEGLLVDDGDDSVLAALASLRETGVRLAIGDFGTGHATLANLGKIPVDAIKIAPTFVAGLGADARLTLLTRTIIDLGRTLGIEVVADGIERPAQRDELVALGCGLGQGPAVRWPVGAYPMRGPAGGARPTIPTRSATEPTDR